MKKNRVGFRYAAALLLLVFGMTGCSWFTDERQGEYEAVREKEILKMADFVNEKYGLHLQTDDCTYYREEDYTRHSDILGNGATYNIPYIAVFQAEGEEITVVDREGFLSDNRQLQEINHILAEYFEDRTGIPIDYIEVGKSYIGSFVGNDNVINAVLQTKYNALITGENVEEFVECLLQEENLSLTFYAHENGGERASLIERITRELGYLGEYPNVEILRVYGHYDDLEILHRAIVFPEEHRDYGNLSEDYDDGYKFGCYYVDQDALALTFSLTKELDRGYGAGEGDLIDGWRFHLLIGKHVTDPIQRLEIQPKALTWFGETDEDDFFILSGMSLYIPDGWKLEERSLRDGVTVCVMADCHGDHSALYDHEIEIRAYDVQHLPASASQLMYDLMSFFGYTSADRYMGDGPVESYRYIMRAQTEDIYWSYFFLSENESGGMELFVLREMEIVDKHYQDDRAECIDDLLEQSLIKVDHGTRKLSDVTSQLTERYTFLNEDEENCVLWTMKRGDYGVLYRYCQFIGEQVAVDREYVCTRSNGSYDNIYDINRDGIGDICFLGFLWSEEDIREKAEGYLWNPQMATFEHWTGADLPDAYVDVLLEREDEKAAAVRHPIPESLTEYIASNIVRERTEVRDALLPLVCSRELSDEEIREIAENNDIFKRDMLATAVSGQGIWVMADGDNDGIEDVFLEQYLGGSLWIVYDHFYKGVGQGQYTLTDERETLEREFVFIEWEGQCYFAETIVDFNKKFYCGIGLRSIEDGRFDDYCEILMVKAENGERYTVTNSFLAQSQYASLAQELERFPVNYDKSGTQILEQICGTAETQDEESVYYQSDIDNDGRLERYHKYEWYPSNHYTRMEIDVGVEADEEAEQPDLEQGLTDALWQSEETGTPVLLWVDSTKYGNVMYVLYEDALYDFHISGFLFSDGEFRKLLQMDYAFELAAEVNHGGNND